MNTRIDFNDKSRKAGDLKKQLLLSNDENDLLTADNIISGVCSSKIYDSCDYQEIILQNKNKKEQKEEDEQEASASTTDLANNGPKKEDEQEASASTTDLANNENNNQSEGQDKNMHLRLHFQTKTQSGYAISGYAIYERSGFIQENGKKVAAYKFYERILIEKAPKQQNTVAPEKTNILTTVLKEIVHSFFNWANRMVEAAKKNFASENKNETAAPAEPAKKTESAKNNDNTNTSSTANVLSKTKTSPGTGRIPYLEKHDVSSISSNFGRESNFRTTPAGYGFPTAKNRENCDRQIHNSVRFKIGF